MIIKTGFVISTVSCFNSFSTLAMVPSIVVVTILFIINYPVCLAVYLINMLSNPTWIIERGTRHEIFFHEKTYWKKNFNKTSNKLKNRTNARRTEENKIIGKRWSSRNNKNIEPFFNYSYLRFLVFLWSFWVYYKHLKFTNQFIPFMSHFPINFRLMLLIWHNFRMESLFCLFSL